MNYLMKKFYTLIFIILLFPLSCSNKPAAIEHGIFAPSRLDSIIGQDGVCSIDFGDNITLWTFADTITGRWKNDKGRIESNQNEAVIDGMISNSIAWSEKITENNYKDTPFSFYKKNGRVKQFIKNNEDEDPLRHRLWALDGFRYKDRVYVFYLHIYVPDYKEFLNFEVLYTGIARWDIPQGWKIGDDFNFKRLGILFEKGSPCFGAAVMLKDDFIYLAGHFKKGEREFPISIARANINDAEKRDSYSFLSSEGEWVADIKAAGEFIGDVSGECSLSYNDYLKEYIIIYSKAFTGDLAMARFKDFKKFPKSKSIVVHKTNRLIESNKLWPYSGKEIFSSNNIIFAIYIDPVKYQPILVELKFK
ncbi:MAG: DUF4185 domain-containing protein [Spirochaetes bacterium]|nr:DUF4185 domain-containing protein [Spirochaetota bacterium]